MCISLICVISCVVIWENPVCPALCSLAAHWAHLRVSWGFTLNICHGRLPAVELNHDHGCQGNPGELKRISKRSYIHETKLQNVHVHYCSLYTDVLLKQGVSPPTMLSLRIFNSLNVLL